MQVVRRNSRSSGADSYLAQGQLFLQTICHGLKSMPTIRILISHATNKTLYGEGDGSGLSTPDFRSVNPEKPHLIMSPSRKDLGTTNHAG